MHQLQKKTHSELSFKDYLENPFKNQVYSLSSKDNLFFKWFDAKFSTDYVKEKLHSANEVKKRFAHHSLLKESKIWIKQKHKVQSWYLYEFYMAVINNGINQFMKEIEVSFISPMGPFKREKAIIFIKPNIYHEIIAGLLIGHELRERLFRYRVDGLVKCFSGNDVYYLNVNQISQNGILMSLNDDSTFFKMQNAKGMRFLFDSSLLQKTKKYSLEIIKQEFSNYPFKLFLTNDEMFSHEINVEDIRFTGQYDSVSEKTNYIYINFKNLKSYKINLNQIVYDFSNNLKNELENELKKNQPLFLVK